MLCKTTYCALVLMVEVTLAYESGGGVEVDYIVHKHSIPHEEFDLAMQRFDKTKLLTMVNDRLYLQTPPDVDAEKINSAIKLIANKQYDTALPLLLSVNGDKQLENMIGVCYMMTGDYGQATTYFEQAIAKGNGDTAEATSNLEQIRIVQSIK